MTAKGGFRNEDDIVRKFDSWKTDQEARAWLEIMGYNLKDIVNVVARKIHGYKTDVQVQITILLKAAIAGENLSIKLVSNPQGFNQVDKRWVDSYKRMWSIPNDVVRMLKTFTGEIKPKKAGLRDPRRMFFDEMPEVDREKILNFFESKRILIVSDILKGRDQMPAGWMLVALKSKSGTKWTLKPINKAMNVFGNGRIEFTSQGSLRIGKITMQRKGGDAGRDSAKMLQFKINPVHLFES